MVMSVKSGQRFSQANKADRQSSMLQHFPDLIIVAQLVRVQPHTLPHQEREIIDMLAGLDFKPVEQLLRDHLKHSVQLLVKQLFVSAAFNS